MLKVPVIFTINGSLTQRKKKSKTHVLQNQCIFIKFLFFLKDVPNIGDGIFAAIVSKIE